MISFIVGVGRKKPQFDHTHLSVYDRVIGNLPRSNNSVEEWHRAFAIRVSISHPTVVKLVGKIRREQSKFEIDIAQILQGHEPKPRKACYLKLDQRIQHLATSYNPSQLDQYLKNISGNINF